jgi:hypothetical protein
VVAPVTDYATEIRRAFIARTTDHELKLARSIELLGTRYVCHPDNLVPKAPQNAPDIVKTDIARTIKRFIKQGKDLV